MSAEFFLDTNVLVYTFDQRNLTRRTLSQQLVQRALDTRQGAISFQVVQECLNITTRRLQPSLPLLQAGDYLANVLEPLCSIWPTIALYDRALQLQERWKFSFYDALIVAAALEAKCSTLYSEDLQHEQRIESLTTLNPFYPNLAVHEEIAHYEVVAAR